MPGSPKVSVIIPYREPTEGEAMQVRRDNMLHVFQYLSRVFPDSDVRLVDDGGDPFSRGATINLGVEQAKHDTIVACDADLLLPYHPLWEAVRMANAEPGQVVPFTRYLYLGREASVAYMAGATPDPKFSYAQSVGGCGVWTRATYEAAHGHDPRFRGWGCEDHGFAHACAALVGPLRKIHADAVHLWHPTDATNDKADPGYHANSALGVRYAEAAGDREAILAIQAEYDPTLAVTHG